MVDLHTQLGSSKFSLPVGWTFLPTGEGIEASYMQVDVHIHICTVILNTSMGNSTVLISYGIMYVNNKLISTHLVKDIHSFILTASCTINAKTGFRNGVMQHTFTAL